MSSINSFAKSGTWDYKNIIVPAATAIPLALSAGSLAKKIFQNPHCIKEKFVAIKNQFIKAPAKSTLIALACLGLMATAAYFSIILLPASMGIAAAISAIFLIGKTFLKAPQYKQKLIETFSAKPGEEAAVARKRIIKNIIKTALVAAAAIALFVVSWMVLGPLLTKGFSWSVSLPFQTKGVVFAEYATLGAIHAALSVSKFKKGKLKEGLFHLFAAALGFIFPAFYWGGEMRLHHSFYGLLMMALPFRTTKFLGSLITFDSSLYMIAPARGYTDAIGRFHSCDFINSIVDNFPTFTNTYVPALILEDTKKNL